MERGRWDEVSSPGFKSITSPSEWDVKKANGTKSRVGIQKKGEKRGRSGFGGRRKEYRAEKVTAAEGIWRS